MKTNTKCSQGVFKPIYIFIWRLSHDWHKKKERYMLSKVQNTRQFVLEFGNFGYDFWGIGGYVCRWLCRQVHRKISVLNDGGLSGGSRMHRPRNPIGLSDLFLFFFFKVYLFHMNPFNILICTAPFDKSVKSIVVKWGTVTL